MNALVRNDIPDAVAVRSLRHHGEDFHAFDDLMLAGGQEFALRRALATLHAVNLDDAEPANRHGLHVRLMAKHGNGNLGFVADFFHVKGNGGIVNRRVTGGRPVLEIEDEISIRVGEGTRHRHLDGLAVDLQGDDFVVVRFTRIILPDQVAALVATENSLIVIAYE